MFKRNNILLLVEIDELKKVIYMNPYDHLESEQSRMEKMRHFMIDNKKYLCEHGGLHPIIERKGKYISGMV